MAGKKSKVEEKKEKSKEEKTESPIIPAANLDISDLFSRLKEFENKALLDRLKTIERSITLLYKEQLSTRVALKEIRQIVLYLSLANEELLNNLGAMSINKQEQFEEKKDLDQKKDFEVKGKKWN